MPKKQKNEFTIECVWPEGMCTKHTLYVLLLVLHTPHRVNVEWLRRNGLGVALWTVNSPEEKKYFHEVLRLPYMTDCVSN